MHLIITIAGLLGAARNGCSGLIVILFVGAVWIGIRQLDYAEFASASRMFLGRKFRRIIDDETRLADFESSLSQAVSIEECWTQIRSGSQSFGFHQVRLNIGGRLFEQACSNTSKPRWQLRIPLANSQYVNFYGDFDSDMNQLVLNAFVEAVQRGLETRSAVIEQYYTTAVGAKTPVEQRER